MASQDDTDSISLGTPSDMDMDNLGDTLSMGILLFLDHENDSGKRTEAWFRAVFATSLTLMISDLFNYAARHGLPF